ncbi:MAG: calcium:proton antiporter [Bacteroidetes bacterium]|nr:calcium:proton antiporter [Bacteroidota bacterium]
MLNFIKNELSTVVALVALLVIFIFVDFEAGVLNSIPASIIFFLLVISVILYAAIGVVHHAEALAHLFGEPYGTLILTLSAVAVEIIMVLAMIFHGDPDPTLARDTVFSTLMILVNGLVGISLFLGGLKFREQKYNFKSTNSYVTLIIMMFSLGFFFPNLIKPEHMQHYFIFIVSTFLIVYFFFLRLQTKEHSYFFSYTSDDKLINPGHEFKKQLRSKKYHILLLVSTITLVSVLAHYLSIAVDNLSDINHLPSEFGAIIIAVVIVSPEGLTAIRAALKNDMQRTINISLGSTISTIALTIPAILIVCMLTHREMILGLTTTQSALIVTSIFVSMITTKTGETNALQGFVHFVLFVTYLVLIFI